MAITIHYHAARPTALNAAEATSITSIVEHYSVDKALQEYLDTGHGLNWESFDFDTDPRAGSVFSGATKLPDNTDEATWIGVQHWCECLSELRRNLPGCVWEVRVEDHEMVWDDAMQAYDPAR